MKRLALLLLAGCGADLSSLDCQGADDLTCPTGYWCAQTGSVVAVCYDESKVPRPDLELEAVGTSPNPTGLAVTLSASNGKSVYLRIRNRSTREAYAPDVKVTAPTCTDLDGESLRIVDTIEGGATYEDDLVFIKPNAGCPSPATATVELTQEGKRFTGTFQVTIGP